MASKDRSVLLYHEKQVAALCGQHCLNTLLQGPYFTEVDLAHIAQELDALEQSFMAESGVDSEAYKSWQNEASGNVAADGMFSIQVLSKALEHWNLGCTNLESADAQASRARPESEQAFICNLQEHWLTIRQVEQRWYNFNSLYPAPEFLGDLYLSAFLATLREQGYSIFVVKGRLPNTHPDQGSSETPGQWFSPQEAKDATKGAVRARESGYLAAALSSCMDRATPEGSLVTLRSRASNGAWEQPRQLSSTVGAAQAAPPKDDADLARAIAASLGDAAGPPDVVDLGAGHTDDPELAAALAASLQDSHAASLHSVEGEADLAVAKLAALDPGPEPVAGPGTVDVALRLPTGERLMRRFRASQRVNDVLNFLRFKQVQVQGHVLTAFPRKVLSDRQQTLQAAGVSNMETLTLQKA